MSPPTPPPTQLNNVAMVMRAASEPSREGRVGMRRSASRSRQAAPMRTAVAIAVALPSVAWAVIRVLGLDSGPLLIPAMSFTPYVAATAWIPIVARARPAPARGGARRARGSGRPRGGGRAARARRAPGRGHRRTVADRADREPALRERRPGRGRGARAAHRCRPREPPGAAGGGDARHRRCGRARAVPVPRDRHGGRRAGQRAAVALPVDRRRPVTGSAERDARGDGPRAGRGPAAGQGGPSRHAPARRRRHVGARPALAPSGHAGRRTADARGRLQRHAGPPPPARPHRQRLRRRGRRHRHRPAGHLPRAPPAADHDRPRARRPPRAGDLGERASHAGQRPSRARRHASTCLRRRTGSRRPGRCG